MSIYRTSRGFGVDWRDEFGRRHRRFVGSIEAAQAVNVKVQESGDQARHAMRNLAACELTWRQAAEAMLAHSRLAENTRTRLTATLERAAVALGNPQVAQVTPRLLETWQDQRRPQVSQNTWSTEAYAVRKLFTYLEENTYILKSPASALDVSTRPSAAARAIDYAEEARLIECATDRVQLRLILALDAGLRRSEVQSLRKNHVNLAERTMTVHSQKTRSVRTLPITARLAAAIAATLGALAPDSHVCGVAAHSLRPSSSADFMRALTQRARVKCRYHDLRHTFATRLSAIEPNPFVIAALLGHTIRTSTAMYVHPTPEQLRRAVDAMEAANPNARPPRESGEPQKGATK